MHGQPIMEAPLLQIYLLFNVGCNNVIVQLLLVYCTLCEGHCHTVTDGCQLLMAPTDMISCAEMESTQVAWCAAPCNLVTFLDASSP